MREQRKSERQRGSVCLDQLHRKSVYSAQFGIKHNRLLSACYCLWSPIKREFIAALRARPSQSHISLSLSLSHSYLCFFFHWGDRSGIIHSARPERQVIGKARYRPEWTGREHRHGHLPVRHSWYHCHLPCHLREWRSDMKLKSLLCPCMWWHFMQLSLTLSQMLNDF